MDQQQNSITFAQHGRLTGIGRALVQALHEALTTPGKGIPNTQEARAYVNFCIPRGDMPAMMTETEFLQRYPRYGMALAQQVLEHYNVPLEAPTKPASKPKAAASADYVAATEAGQAAHDAISRARATSAELIKLLGS